jgi:Endonuclease/Exonuclease/phosphatase family
VTGSDSTGTGDPWSARRSILRNLHLNVENRDDEGDNGGAPMIGRCLSLTLALSLLSLAACRDLPERMPEPPDAASSGMARVPPRGTATTLDIASWNLEWFGDTSYGPTDEARQLRNVLDVIGGTDFDLWGLAEVVSTEQFESLLDQLPGYEGFLANDARVVGGPASYSDFENLEQKVGLLYKASIFTVLGASVILAQDDQAFAGRPPLEVKLRASLGGATQDMVVIVMHAKCCSDLDSYQRRVDASSALKAYLDATYPTQMVWVIGDWNDDLTTSISNGQPSPYQNFVADRTRYTVETEPLSIAHVGSTVHYNSTIDHHMVTDEAAAAYVAGSVEVYRVDAYVPSYGLTTSDHYPVLSRYQLGAAADRGRRYRRDP